jgi:hypothetical protein
MTRDPFPQTITKILVVSSSVVFLGMYIAAKISVWPWGTYSY